MVDGLDSELVRLTAGAFTAKVLTYGATLVAFEAPGPGGEPVNCVLTLANPGDLADPNLNPHLGGIVGPYANRIAGASFDLGGVTYALESNEGPNTLHGGSTPWDRRRWGVASVHADDGAVRVTLTLSDPNGQDGFPGQVDAIATYSLDGDGTLKLDVVCTTDRPTVVAPTNHTYWNLAGAGTIADHRLSVAADAVLELGPGQIPTGAALPVEEGRWDLRDNALLGDRLTSPELWDLGGFDHTFLVDGTADRDELPLVARLVDPGSGRTLEMRTDQPAVHVYTGNHLDNEPGQHGPMARHGGLCLEAGQVPNGPNLATIATPDGSIPVDVTIRPGDPFRWATSWRLAADGDAEPSVAPHG